MQRNDGDRPDQIVFFDLETTGLSWRRHTVCQIAAIAMTEDLSTEVGVFEVKVKFRVEDASPEALEINSFDPEVWELEAVGPRQAERLFSEFLKAHATTKMRKKNPPKKGSPFYYVARGAGHNAAAFDMPFLKAWYRRMDKFCPMAFLCRDTLQLALWLADFGIIETPENFKVATLAAHFEIEHDEGHDALVDVRTTVGIARELRDAIVRSTVNFPPEFEADPKP